MIHMRLMTPSGDLNGFGVTGSQWQVLRKSPVVEDTFLEDDWNLTVTGSDLPEDVQAYISVPTVSTSSEFLLCSGAACNLLTPSTAKTLSRLPCSATNSGSGTSMPIRRFSERLCNWSAKTTPLSAFRVAHDVGRR